MTSSVPVSRNTAIDLIHKRPGLSDREIAATLIGPEAPESLVNSICRELVAEGTTRRRLRPDGLLGNHVSDLATFAISEVVSWRLREGPSRDFLVGGLNRRDRSAENAVTGAMESHAAQAARWRKRAERLRVVAESMDDDVARTDLMAVAARWDQMAEEAEARADGGGSRPAKRAADGDGSGDGLRPKTR
jgi:hypothetical protein